MRIDKIAQRARERGANQPENTLQHDRHRLARTKYKDLPLWEKVARSMSEAIVTQNIYIDGSDHIIGRVYHLNSKPIGEKDPDLDSITVTYKQLCEDIPGYAELAANNLCGTTGVGHIAWAWDNILRLGTSGMKAQYEHALARAADEPAKEFYSGVLIMLDALEAWNDKHVAALERRGMNAQAAICRKVPRYPAETFAEAVQSFFMQHIVVVAENWGNSPGRLDYYLWPYLEKDLECGRCTLAQARELVDELFIRMDERIHTADMWGETIVVGGSHPNGASAVNPLSHIMIESIMSLDITHPLVYARVPQNAPEDFLRLCARYVKDGGNKAQILSDENIMRALTKSGVPYHDAAHYVCGGCMEIGLQGMTSDFLYNGWQNIPKIAELFTTGGECLQTGKRFSAIQARGLAAYDSFDTFYRDFTAEVTRILHIFFRAQDAYSERAETSRPLYLISSMIQDCLPRGRNMHGGGARYHDYGSTPIGLPNTADYLFAIKKAVFDDGICTAEELLAAMRANFEGHGELRHALRRIPKYGQENAEADALAARLFADVGDMYASYRNRFGGRGKCTILTFVWATEAGNALGASADGNLAGKPVAQALTPQSSSMTKGITAAMNSCGAMPWDVFNGGATTMWDLDPAWASEEVIRALLTTYFAQGGQIYQGNVTDAESLLRAQANPGEHQNLIVRVGGYSARFVMLSKELQNEIIGRIRHAG